MGSYEIAVYVTDSLYNRCQDNHGDGYIAQTRAKTYLQGAFDRTNHSVSFLTPPSTPNAPTEYYSKSFTTACPCDTRYNCSYEALLGWFQDWVECNNKPKAQDSNILLSNTSNVNGGLAQVPAGTYAHAQTGRYIARLPPSYEKYGMKESHNGMHTAIEVVGHNLIGSVDDDDGDGGKHHDLAVIKDHGYQKETITGMGIKGSQNECGTYWDTSTIDGNEMAWSDCAVSKFA